MNYVKHLNYYCAIFFRLSLYLYSSFTGGLLQIASTICLYSHSCLSGLRANSASVAARELAVVSIIKLVSVRISDKYDYRVPCPANA